jgi:hypothetical protein
VYRGFNDDDFLSCLLHRRDFLLLDGRQFIGGMGFRALAPVGSVLAVSTHESWVRFAKPASQSIEISEGVRQRSTYGNQLSYDYERI